MSWSEVKGSTWEFGGGKRTFRSLNHIKPLIILCIDEL